VSTLIETAKLTGVNAYAYPTDVLTRMVEGHLVSKHDELLSWNWKPAVVNA
jgi:transposase